MSKPIITKQCPKCKQVKSLNNFYKDRASKDKHTCHCRICICKRVAKYRKTEKGKTCVKYHNQTKKHKISVANWRRTKQGKAKEKAIAKQYHAQFPERLKAKTAVNHAVVASKLPKIKSLQCYLCFKPAQHYHHYLGYEPKYWLDILPICAKCHKIQDSPT